MSEILDLPDQQPSPSTKFILTHIWFRPRRIFVSAGSIAHSWFFYLMIVVAGIVWVFGVSYPLWGNSPLRNTGVLFLAGLIFGTLGTILFAWLFRWTGRLLGGTANGIMVFNVLVCAQTPLIVALASWFLAGILLNVIPHNNFERFSPMFNYVGWAVTWFTYALRLWAFVLLLVGLSVVHKFSMAKAAASIALSMLIVGTFIAAWWMISAQNFE